MERETTTGAVKVKENEVNAVSCNNRMEERRKKAKLWKKEKKSADQEAHKVKYSTLFFHVCVFFGPHAAAKEEEKKIRNSYEPVWAKTILSWVA